MDFIAAVYEKQIPFGNDNQKGKGKNNSKSLKRRGRGGYAEVAEENPC